MSEFDIKNELLTSRCEEVSAVEFYRDVFPKGSFEEKGDWSGKANGILCSINEGKGRHSIVFDDLDEIEEHLNDDFVIISPIAYFGRRRSAYNASLMYGMCFDLDDVGQEQLTFLLDRLENPHFPRATYIANSGCGLHLYYLLKQPLPLYKSKFKQLNNLKHGLTRMIWNKYTSRIPPENRQYQGILQGFRMVGSATKHKQGRIRVFKTGYKVDFDYFNNYVNPEYKLLDMGYESSLTLEEAKKKYPEWYERRIIHGEKRGRWHVKRALYDWWLEKIKTDDDLKTGHRYFAVCALAAYAIKCDISEDELRRDAYSLQTRMNNIQNDFSADDIEAALNFYQESYVTFPRDEIAKLTGLQMPTNRRNGHKQEEHLEEIRAIRDIRQARKGTHWYDNGGRPKGSANKDHLKRDVIRAYAAAHPEANHSEIARALGVSRTTVIKWLKS